MKRGRAAVIFIVAIDIIAVVIFVVLSVLDAMKTATVGVVVAPTTAEVYINGEKYANGGYYNIVPGEIVVKAEAEGMVAKEMSYEAKSGEVTRIRVYLTGGDEDFTWYETRDEEMAALSEFDDDERVAKFLEKMKIREVLPYKYVDYDESTDTLVRFMVDVYESDECGEKLCLQAVDLMNSSQELMKNKMQEEGYNLDDYAVFYF